MFPLEPCGDQRPPRTKQHCLQERWKSGNGRDGVAEERYVAVWLLSVWREAGGQNCPIITATILNCSSLLRKVPQVATLSPSFLKPSVNARCKEPSTSLQGYAIKPFATTFQASHNPSGKPTQYRKQVAFASASKPSLSVGL